MLMSRDRFRSCARAWPVAFALLLSATAARAQDEIQVTSADPDMAEQGTVDLDVMVGGSNFPSLAEVDFYITGTCDYTSNPDCVGDPGGITVKKVKRQGPKNLKVTISVDEGAQTEFKFDILVRRGGRSGKGTELFAVTEKQPGGQDTTPPADVSDLELVGQPGQPVLQADGDYEALFTWTAPADDQGALAEYWLKVRPGDSFELEDWDEFVPSLYRNATWWPPPPGAPGTTESGAPRFLAPETEYTAALRSADPSGNWSGLSNMVTFLTGPVPPSDWLAEEVDGCPPGSIDGSITDVALAYGSDDRPAVFYSKKCDPSGPPAYVARWTPTGWDRAGVDFPYGESSAFEIEPFANQPVILASPLAIQAELSLHHWTGTAWTSEVIDSGKFPYGDRDLATYSDGSTQLLAAAYRAAPKGRSSSVRLAVWDGQAWESHDISSSYNRGNAAAAFDDLGRAAVAYEDDTDRDGSPDTLQFALWSGSSWEAETVDDLQDPEHPVCGRGASLQWNAARGEFWASHYCVNDGPGHSQRVRICGQSSPAGTWQCSDLPLPEDDALGGGALAFDQHGIAYVSVSVGDSDGGLQAVGFGMLRLLSRDTLNPSSSWSSETVDWTTGLPPVGLRVDPDSGEPAVFHYAPLRPVPTVRLMRRQPQ